MTRARVLLADDHEACAKCLRAMLEPEFDVIATVADGLELLRAAGALPHMTRTEQKRHAPDPR